MNPTKILIFSNLIDRLTEGIGKSVAWLTVAMAFLTCIIVIARKFFGWNSIALQESVIYLHAAVFLLALGYTLQQEAHVRVDIFYRRFSSPTKAWINCFGYIVLLLPFSLYFLNVSWPFVETSWRIKEISSDPGGIPAVFLLKTLIPAATVLLILQALAELLRNVIIIAMPTANVSKQD